MILGFPANQVSKFISKPKILIITPETTSLIYCRARNLQKKADILSALHSPFDGSTWANLLVTFVPGLTFSRATDLLWAFLAQPPQKHKFGLLMIALSILMIPLQSSYTTYFTSNAVIPFVEPFIETNQEPIPDSKSCARMRARAR